MPVALWLRADQGITEVATTVAAWNDLSGKGRHFSQSTSVLRPNYISSETDFPIPQPAVKFNVADSCLAGPSFTLRYVAIVAVFPNTAFSPYNGLFTAVNSSESPSNAGGAFIGNQGDGTWYTGNDTGGNKFRDGADTNVALTTANAPHVWENQFSVDRTFYWQVGRDREVSGRQWTDSVAEIIGLDYTPTPMQVEAIREYLNARYGFSVPILPKTGLRLWLDAAAQNITLNGGDVSGWADASGQGNNASQSTAALQPLYETNQWNSGSYPSLLINGESAGEHLIADSLASTLSGDNTPFTITLVCQVITNPTAERYFWSVAAAGPGPYNLLRISGTDLWGANMRDDIGNITAFSEAVSTYDTNRHQFTLHFDGTTRTLYKDGVSIATSSTALGTCTFDRFTIGRLRRTALEEGIDYRTPGMTVYNRALSAGELTALWDYNRNHFGGLP